MNLLIDADLVAFRCAATVSEDMDRDIAFYRMDVLIQQIIEATEGASYSLYLTGKVNVAPLVKTLLQSPLTIRTCRRRAERCLNQRINSGITMS